jgi:hypothetical protein
MDFVRLMTPLLYILLFSPLLKNMVYPPRTTAEVLDIFVPGVLTILAFGSGSGAGWTVLWELQSGAIERFRVTPASRFSIMLGSVLNDIVSFLVPSVLVVVISSLSRRIPPLLSAAKVGEECAYSARLRQLPPARSAGFVLRGCAGFSLRGRAGFSLRKALVFCCTGR